MDILLYSWQRLTQPSSENNPLGNQHRDPQPENVKKVRDFVAFSPKGGVYIKSGPQDPGIYGEEELPGSPVTGDCKETVS